MAKYINEPWASSEPLPKVVGVGWATHRSKVIGSAMKLMINHAWRRPSLNIEFAIQRMSTYFGLVLAQYGQPCGVARLIVNGNGCLISKSTCVQSVNPFTACFPSHARFPKYAVVGQSALHSRALVLDVRCCDHHVHA